MNKETVEKIMNDACETFYRNSKNLIDEKAHERTIVAEMLPYLREHFPHYTVLSEYNREGAIDERQSKRDLDGNLLIPDIIVHEFGPNGRNLVAIEVKGHWNDEPREIDDAKLRSIQLKHGYEFLYRIELGKHKANIIAVLPV